jgi:hypothetical protein
MLAGGGLMGPGSSERIHDSDPSCRLIVEIGAARDFVDIYVLVRHFSKDTLLARATLMDVGFDARVLVDLRAMLALA